MFNFAINTDHFCKLIYNGFMFKDIFNRFCAYNKEEVNYMNYYLKNNKYPSVIDSAHVLDGKSYISNGMMVIRKHPRFCHVGEHSHNYLEINYVLKGEIKELLDGNTITLKQGELLFISKNSVHEFLPAQEDDVMLNFIILPEFFDYLFPLIGDNGNLKKFLVNLLNDNKETNSIIFHVSKSEIVQNLIQNIMIICDEKDSKMNELLRQYFLILINELLRHTELAEDSKTSNYDSIIVFKTLNYIENNYTSASLKGLSELLNDDYNYLSKRIKKLTGFTFQQLLEKERIKASLVLLESTDANINDIAYHIGYNNLTFFYKLFKKNVGMNPLEYRNKNNKENSTSIE